jgi:hypothetical protein
MLVMSCTDVRISFEPCLVLVNRNEKKERKKYINQYNKK